MRAELVPIDGGPPIPIIKDITVIGRREYCDVQLDDPSLSKRHCVIIKTDGLLMIRDLASTNGTRVKGQLIRWAALLPNDRIALGKLKFRIYLGPAEPMASQPANSARARRDRPAAAGSSVPHPPTPKSPAPVVASVPPMQIDNDRPEFDLDDSRWFDQINPGSLRDQIIDLE